ncbi:hypothetical protein [Paenibacillus sp. QZ-Y1]|uniref:hypothetical protein n=1 Tax=Paenibacillus sp. QZ-Y1 TaxID=3414511 RepID=UPI003F7A11CF
MRGVQTLAEADSVTINVPSLRDWVFLLLVEERVFTYNESKFINMLPHLIQLIGKHEQDVNGSLDAVVAAESIHWEDNSDKANIVFLEDWEREGKRPKIECTPSSGNTDYWAEY